MESPPQAFWPVPQLLWGGPESPPQAFWPVPQLLWAVAPSPPQRCISDRLPTVYDREYVHLLIWMKFSWQLIFQIMLLNCNG
ncbi:MAG: hypothetical protein JGK29_31575 [Microcoleus sp. PH2017_17_BER_D_A]|nr:hypothetical protein [Microcoleus sp. PH2017_17_BER_D_A]